MNNNISSLGFNGEYLDDTLDNYHLGNGYRAYNPAIMQFTAPDDMSPFGQGGINPYVYVSCDPINKTDPTGHFNLLGIHISMMDVIVIGSVIGGLISILPTAGASLAAATAIAGSSSIATGIAAENTTGPISTTLEGTSQLTGLVNPEEEVTNLSRDVVSIEKEAITLPVGSNISEQYKKIYDDLPSTISLPQTPSRIDPNHSLWSKGRNLFRLTEERKGKALYKEIERLHKEIPNDIGLLPIKYTYMDGDREAIEAFQISSKHYELTDKQVERLKKARRLIDDKFIVNDSPQYIIRRESYYPWEVYAHNAPVNRYEVMFENMNNLIP